jgi:hypothetical protein
VLIIIGVAKPNFMSTARYVSTGATRPEARKIQFRHGSGANPERLVRIAQTRLRVPVLQQQ